MDRCKYEWVQVHDVVSRYVSAIDMHLGRLSYMYQGRLRQIPIGTLACFSSLAITFSVGLCPACLTPDVTPFGA
jgi:hypothetical protein